MSFDLNEQEKMIQSLARDFSRKTVQPQASQIDNTGQSPAQIAREMGNLGFYGLPFPTQYGGAGAS